MDNKNVVININSSNAEKYKDKKPFLKTRFGKIVVIALALTLVLLMFFLYKGNPYRNYLVNKYGLSYFGLIQTYHEDAHDNHITVVFATSSIPIPAKTVFLTFSGRSITVIDNNGTISDDYQIQSISEDLAPKYFSKLTGYNVKFVEFTDYSFETYKDEKFSSALSDFIQSKDGNFRVESDNIKKFILGFINHNNSNEIKIYINNSADGRSISKIDPFVIYNSDSVIEPYNTLIYSFLDKSDININKITPSTINPQANNSTNLEAEYEFYKVDIINEANVRKI